MLLMITVVLLLPAAQLESQTLDFGWMPTEPEIGSVVAFLITGFSSVESATWSFGGQGCGDYSETAVCIPGLLDCLQQSYRYAEAGSMEVTLTVASGGVWYGPVSHTIEVQPTGSCPVECTYSVSPEQAWFDALGGLGEVNVMTSWAGCSWVPIPDRAWIDVVSGSGAGDGVVSFTVSPNTGAPRAGTIHIHDQIFAINQSDTFDFWWSPASPEVGLMTLFGLAGAPFQIDQLSWDFGGPGCNSESQYVVCMPGVTDCLHQTFRFAAPGSHIVELSVQIEGNWYGPVSQVVELADTYTCEEAVFNDGYESGTTGQWTKTVGLN